MELLRNKITAMRGEGKKWQSIADEYQVDGNQVNRGTIWLIANDPNYEPKDDKIRDLLGLSLRSMADARRCECGKVYVPNVPWRHHCFICRPPKRKADE